MQLCITVNTALCALFLDTQCQLMSNPLHEQKDKQTRGQCPSPSNQADLLSSGSKAQSNLGNYYSSIEPLWGYPLLEVIVSKSSSLFKIAILNMAGVSLSVNAILAKYLERLKYDILDEKKTILQDVKQQTCV